MARHEFLRKDDTAAGLALYLAVHICAEEAPEETVVVIAQHDDVSADPPRCVHNRMSRLARRPNQLRLEAGCRQAVARLREMRDHVRRRRKRVSLVRRDVVQRPKIARHVEIEREIRNAQDGDAPVRVTRWLGGS